jgi:ubiquinone/menaquinone biosynthesis C-methylase UbiE
MNTLETRNPQADQMADESMQRTLREQITAIWPQESRLYSRYALPAGARVLDLGCGTGEATLRLAAIFPGAHSIVGVDVMPELLAVAARRELPPGPSVTFEEGDGFALRFADETFDLVVCRHVTQLVPQPQRLLAELVRVLRPGGWLHVLSEDYGMLHFPPRNGVDPDRLWHEAVVAFTAQTGTDARVGRRTLPMLQSLGLSHTSIQYLVLDTERVPREVLAGIFTAWRDGYVDALAAAAHMSPTEVRDLFEAVIATIRDPAGYGVWQVPVVAGRKPC